MQKKLRCGFDINNTVDNYIQTLLVHYNTKYHDNVKFEDLTDYHIYEFLKPNCKDIFIEFTNEKLMSELKLVKDAKDVLNYCFDNYEVKFVTSVYIEHLNYFYKWLQQKLFWVKSSHISRLEDKSNYCVDILIDDKWQNLDGGQYDKILIDAPYNKNIDAKALGMNRAYNMKEVLWYIKNIAEMKDY